MIHHSHIMSWLLVLGSTVITAADKPTVARPLTETELVFESTLHHVPLLDRTSVCALALVNTEMRKRVMATKDIRKAVLMDAVRHSAETILSDSSDCDKKAVYSCKYCSLFVYFTKSNQLLYQSLARLETLYDINAHILYVEEGKIEVFSPKKRLMRQQTWNGEKIQNNTHGSLLVKSGYGVELEGPFLVVDVQALVFFETASSPKRQTITQVHLATKQESCFLYRVS